MTQINAEYDGCVVCQKDQPVVGISHESIFAITPANNSRASRTAHRVGSAEVNVCRACYTVGWKPALLQSRRQLTTTKESSYPEDRSRKAARHFCQPLPTQLLSPLPQHFLLLALTHTQYFYTKINTPVTPQQLQLQLNPLPQIFHIRRVR